VFLVHRLDLLHQVLDVLRGKDGHPGIFRYPELVGQVGGGVYEPNVVTVMTVQTICAALDIETDGEDETDDYEKETDTKGAVAHRDAIEQCLLRARVVVVDECHHVPAKTIFSVLAGMGKASFRYGLSATDWRDDGTDLLIEAGLGPRIVNISLSDLVDLGYLVPAKITMYDIESSPWDGLGKKANWLAVYRQYIVENEKLNKKVVSVNKEWYNEGRTILTLVTQIKHGEALKEAHEKEGIPSVFLSGQDNIEFRKETLDSIRNKTLRHLIATSIADEGLDLPALDALNLAGGGRSSTKVYQRIGRILRPFDNKTSGLVADYFVGAHKWLEAHSQRRLQMYKRERAFHLGP
jgi:superfamily II DNA or RNA helicase